MIMVQGERNVRNILPSFRTDIYRNMVFNKIIRMDTSGTY